MQLLSIPILPQNPKAILPSVIHPNIVRAKPIPNVELVSYKRLHSLHLHLTLTMPSTKLMHRTARKEHTSPIRMRRHQQRKRIRDLNSSIRHLTTGALPLPPSIHLSLRQNSHSPIFGLNPLRVPPHLLPLRELNPTHNPLLKPIMQHTILRHFERITRHHGHPLRTSKPI